MRYRIVVRGDAVGTVQRCIPDLESSPTTDGAVTQLEAVDQARLVTIVNRVHALGLGIVAVEPVSP